MLGWRLPSRLLHETGVSKSGGHHGPDVHPVARRVAEAIDAEPVACRELTGGMVGQVHRVDLSDGETVVAKTGETRLSVEADMLRYLETHTELPVPGVEAASDDLLVMEYVPGDSRMTPDVQRDLADQLATLHDHTADRFGFGVETIIGPLEQPNPWTDAWIPFFRNQRLLEQARRALAEEQLDRARFERVAAVAADLEELLEEPDEPALIHGDVWRTNVLASDGTVRAVLDPAIYFAHPEVELAYVDWSDAVGDPFFDRYRERRGIDPGFRKQRRHVYRLYPVVVHVRVFGDRYLEWLDDALSTLGY